MARKIISVFERVENTEGKQKNADYQHYLFFPPECFQKPCPSGLLKVGIVWYGVKAEDCVDWTKFKAFADDKLIVAKIMISVFDRVENNVGKGENAGNQHFLLFPHCF